MPRYTASRLWPLAITAAWLITCLAGCGLTAQQNHAVSVVAGASRGLGQYAEGELGFLRRANMDMNVYYLALRPTADFRKTDLQGTATLKNLQIRVKAARALSNYGELLGAMIKDTQSKGLSQAADDFAGNLGSLPGMELSKDEAGALAGLMAAVGSQVVEYQRARALAGILPGLAGPVERLCGLLIKDFSSRELGLLSDSRRIHHDLEDQTRVVLKTKRPLAERLAALRARRLALEVGQRLDLMEGQAAATLKGLIHANRQMIKALENKEYSRADLKKFARQVTHLAQDVRTLALGD